MVRLFLTLVLTVALGLLSRLHPIGWFIYDKSLGDVLYAVAAYLTLALLLFRKRLALVALLALVLCLAVECFKTTGIPARFAQVSVIPWFLGTTFAWHNLGCYFIGVLSISGIDGLLLAPWPAANLIMPAHFLELDLVSLHPLAVSLWPSTQPLPLLLEPARTRTKRGKHDADAGRGEGSELFAATPERSGGGSDPGLRR